MFNYVTQETATGWAVMSFVAGAVVGVFAGLLVGLMIWLIAGQRKH